MPALGKTEVEKFDPGVAQQFFHLDTSVLVGTMYAPSSDDLISPMGGCCQGVVIFGAHRFVRTAHGVGVGVAPGKDVGDLKRAETQMPCAGFAAGNGGVILDFIGL